jgi:spermidine synthase
VIGRARTAEGDLVLERRGDDYVLTRSGLIVMSSRAHQSERDLATRVCERVRTFDAPRVLVAGLGMGFTLRAVAEALPKSAAITVVELVPEVVEWSGGPLSGLSGAALSDPRVTVLVGDVFATLRADPGRWAGIALDLWQGPFERRDPVFTPSALRICRDALRPGGRLGIWSEQSVGGFEERLRGAGFVEPRKHVARRGFRHVVYTADRS